MSAGSAVTVRVPASTSNLGAGFDALGMALGLYVEVRAELADELCIEIEGREADQIDRGPDNLLYQRFALVYRERGEHPPAVRLRIRNEIPLIRGLGSSGAATIAGLLAASVLSGANLSHDEILRLAYAEEHHSDNVTPALVGGFVARAVDEGRVRYVKMDVPPELRCVLLVPRFGMKTVQARQLLPGQVPLQDAVFNLSRAGLTVAAITQRRWDLLAVGTQDRLHQPYRLVMFPIMDRVFQAAREAGAYGAFLSGAGSTVLAFSPPERTTQVAEAMRQVAESAEVACETMDAPVDTTGAVVS